MTDANPKAGVPWAVVAVVLLVAYPVSMPAVGWLANHGYISVPPWASIFYWPLVWVLEKLPDQFFDWYVKLVTS